MFQLFVVFFFKQKTAYEMRISDWSSDVCSSDLAPFWWVAEQALRGLIALAHHVAAAPGAIAALPIFPRWAFGLAIFGGLWLLLWQTRWRWCGALPLDRKSTRLNSSH